MTRIAIIPLLRGLLIALLISAIFVSAKADEPMIKGVMASKQKDNTWRFDVTVSHHDQGWDHYADRWEVLGPDGKVLATRVLQHPHDDEQPFTRSLDGIVIPDGVTVISLRAHDKVHGNGALVTLDLEMAGSK